MTGLLERRVRWCPAVTRRLFANPAPLHEPAAWDELTRDPALLGERRWREALGDAAPAAERPAPKRRDDERADAPHRAATPFFDQPPPPASRTTGPARAPRDTPAMPIDLAARRAVPLRAPAASTAYASTIARTDGSSRSPSRVSAELDAAARTPGPPGTPPAEARPRLRPVVATPPGADRPSTGRVTAPGFASLATNDGAPSDATPSVAPTRLVQGTAGLARMLALAPTRATAAGSDSARTVDAPAASPATIAPLAPSRHPPADLAASAVIDLPTAHAPPVARDATLDVDTLLDALAERLRIDYLRHYGSAG